MMIGCPIDIRIRSLTTRASVSVGPPAANGTIIVTGRDAYVSAAAALPTRPAAKEMMIEAHNTGTKDMFPPRGFGDRQAHPCIF
jgi:hypothetical protein